MSGSLCLALALRASHAVMESKCFFFFFYFCVVPSCMNSSPFIFHSSAGGHLGCFQIWALPESCVVSVSPAMSPGTPFPGERVCKRDPWIAGRARASSSSS